MAQICPFFPHQLLANSGLYPSSFTWTATAPPSQDSCLVLLTFPTCHFNNRKCDPLTSLPNIQPLILIALRIRQQGSLWSGLCPHLATLPNWHLQVFITSFWVHFPNYTPALLSRILLSPLNPLVSLCFQSRHIPCAHSQSFVPI